MPPLRRAPLAPALALALALALGLAPLPPCAAQPQLPSNWASVASFPWPALESPPPGCECQSASCAQFDCGCVCDLTAGQCDANCCCDADCSALELARATGLGACRPQGPKNLSLTSCASVALSQQVALVNPGARMSVQSSSAGADAVLCVAVDNSPLLGSFLADPGLLPASTLDAAGVARVASFQQPRGAEAAALAAAAALASSASFDIGAPVPARKPAAGGALVAAFGGSWRLPTLGGAAAASGGAPCSLAGGGDFVAFRGAVEPPQQCLATQVLTAATCADLSSAAYVADLSVGAFPAAAAAADFVPVTLRSVSAVNASTGAFLGGAAPSAAATFVPAAGGADCVCRSALVGLSYVVTYAESTMRIVAVAADVTVADVAQAEALCGVEAVTVPVTVGVAFVPQSPATPVVGRSGEPGYVLGSPLLGGVLVSSAGLPLNGAAPSAGGQYVVARSAPAGSLLARFEGLGAGFGFALAGLTLRGAAADGSCVAAPGSGGRDAAASVPVRFGEDLATSCALQLTAAQLQALCSGAGPQAATAAFVGLGSVQLAAGAAPATHVGILGNADPYKAWQWLPFAAGAGAAPVASWDTTGVFPRCSSIVTGVDIELLVAPVGSANNPQNKVVAARVSYPTSAWTFSREDGGAQRFLLTSTVTYTYFDKPASTSWLPAPPIIPAMPDDLWYPFSSNAGGASQIYVPSASGAGAAALATAAGLAALAAAARLALN